MFRRRTRNDHALFSNPSAECVLGIKKFEMFTDCFSGESVLKQELHSRKKALRPHRAFMEARRTVARAPFGHAPFRFHPTAPAWPDRLRYSDGRPSVLAPCERQARWQGEQS